MTQGNVTMTVRKVGDHASVVDIRGDVNADAENAFLDAYTQASTGGVKTIILNFSELEYMNSTGIGLLVTLLMRVKSKGQSLMAVGLSEHYQHIFELTRLNEAIPVFDDEAAAIASLT